MRKCNKIEDVCTGVPINLHLLFRLILMNEIFNFQMFGYEIESDQNQCRFSRRFPMKRTYRSLIITFIAQFSQ